LRCDKAKFAQRLDRQAGPLGHLGDLIAHRTERLGRTQHRGHDGRAQPRDLEPHGADGLAEGLELLLRPAQAAHELAVVGKQLDERPARSDALG